LENIQEQERHLRALHDLLPEVLSVGSIAAAYAKMLRTRRQKLHPAGVEDVRTVETASGLKLDVDIGDRLGCDFFYGFFQERTEFEILMTLVDPGAIFVDVGANVGLYALEACLRAGKGGRVLAIEPDPRSARLLARNIEQNEMGDRLECATVCAGQQDGEVEFYAAMESSFSGMGASGRSATRSVMKVPMRSLDSLLVEAGYPQVDLLKIDVEGFEYAVVLGALDTLRKSDAIIMMEISGKNLLEAHRMRLAEALSNLNSCGYRLFSMPQDGNKLMVVHDPAALFSADGPKASGSLFLARGETGSARRLDQAFQLIRDRQRTPLGLFKNSWAACPACGPNSGGACHVSVDRLAIRELIEFVIKTVSNSNPARPSYEDKIRNLTTHVQQAQIGRQACREQLEGAIAELEQVRVSRQAYREKLEGAIAELEQARVSRQAYREKLEGAIAELEQARVSRQAYREKNDRALMRLDQTMNEIESKRNQINQLEKELAMAKKGLLGFMVRCKIRYFGSESHD
jgi:FkbM family methyltransferase